jgi:hypothetical protein
VLSSSTTSTCTLVIGRPLVSTGCFYAMGMMQIRL